MENYASTMDESAIIATILAYPEYGINIASQLKLEYFVADNHQIIIKSILDLISDNKIPEITAVYNRLKETDDHFKIGGFEGLREFISISSRPEFFQEWINEIKKIYRIRCYVEMADNIIRKARNKASADELHDYIQTKMISFEATIEEEGLIPDSKVMVESLAFLKERIINKGKIAGLSTSLRDLDEITNGFRPGHITTVGARPGMGKTSFALNIASNLAFKENKVIAFYSLEMPRVELMNRLISSTLEISNKKFANGSFTNEDVQKINENRHIFSQELIHINDKSNVNVLDISSECRQLKRRKGKLDMIIIDYIQLMKPVSSKFYNREQELASISKELKELAKSLNCSILALAQLNRGLESRADHKPRASDLRESGQIEADSDVVLLLHREEVYNPESTEKGLAEIIIGKNRHGAMENVNVAYNKEFTKFVDLVKF